LTGRFASRCSAAAGSRTTSDRPRFHTQMPVLRIHAGVVAVCRRLWRAQYCLVPHFRYRSTAENQSPAMTPMFEAPAGPHEWLARTMIVGTGQRLSNPDRSQFTYYRVK